MIVTCLKIVLALATVPFAVQVLTFGAEVFASFFARKRGRPEHRETPLCAVVIPAHNEQEGILRTLDGVRRQLRPDDRLIVVADNCSDQTAAIARAHGTEVIERFHDKLRGKGYALNFGVEHIKSSGPAPDVMIIIDADCHLGEDCIARIAAMSHQDRAPVQAKYLIEDDQKRSTLNRFRQFAVRVKNFVRPLGGSALGFPAPLLGTGMAFPWSIIEKADLATGHIAEDSKLGIELTLLGHPARYCPDALVTSQFPETAKGRQTQTTRWEHGHLALIRNYWFPLIGAGFRQMSLKPLGLALDLGVLPLGLLFSATFSLFLFGAGGALLWGADAALALPLLTFPLLVSCLLIAWLAYGRDLLGAGDVLAVPSYAASKVFSLLSFLGSPQKTWVRSDRSTQARKD
jgi:cellulose synthase/poly-beta-1,6-N-acetylglucosamine synthase-like glycosyltransferase